MRYQLTRAWRRLLAATLKALGVGEDVRLRLPVVLCAAFITSWRAAPPFAPASYAVQSSLLLSANASRGLDLTPAQLSASLAASRVVVQVELIMPSAVTAALRTSSSESSSFGTCSTTT